MKKKSKEWLAREIELRQESNDILARSQTLRKAADRTMEIINKFNEDYPDHLIESMPWEEKEKMFEIGMDLMKKLKKNAACLFELDKEYDAMREKVNEFYGEEIMQKSDPLAPWPDEEKEERKDSADWWKE